MDDFYGLIFPLRISRLVLFGTGALLLPCFENENENENEDA